MKMKLFFLAALLLAAVFGSEEVDDPDVLVLTNDNFDAAIAEHDLLLVEFYAPWCGHCKHLAPEYAAAATELKASKISIAKVDADNEANKPLASRFGVRGFPTIKLFRKGEPVDYQGERTSAAIVSYMKKQALPSVSVLSTVEQVSTFSTEDKVVIVGFFAQLSGAEYDSFKATAEKLRDKFLFGAVSGSEEVATHFGAAAPGAILFKKFDEGKNVFSGDFAEFAQFVAKYSVPLIDEIGPENYRDYVESGLPLAYLFVDTSVADQQKTFVERVTETAKAAKGKLNFVWIDWVKYAKHSERLGLSGQVVPAVAIEHAGHHYAFDETKEVTTESVAAWISGFLEGKVEPTIKSEAIPEKNDEPVKVVVAKSFKDVVLGNKDVFVEFYAPWCGHCKQLAPTYEELAKKFSGVDSVVIAKMDATANDVDPKYGVRGFPTIKLFPSDNSEPIDYEGDRSLDDMASFIQKNAKTAFTLDAAAAVDAKDEL